MFYALIRSVFNYSMHNVLRMKEIKTQKAATRNRTQFIFIQSIIPIHVFPQGSQFPILHYDLFHYSP